MADEGRDGPIVADGMAGREGFELWRRMVDPLFDVHLSRESAPAAFQASSRTSALGAGFLARASAGAQHFSRTPAFVRQSGWDHVLVQLYTEGGYHGVAGERPVRVDPGEISLLDLGRTLQTTATGFSNVSLLVPREKAGGLGDFHGRVFRAGRAHTALVRTHIQFLSRHADAMTGTEGEVGVDALLHLVSGEPIRSADPAVKATVASTLRALVADHVDRHLAQPDLSPTSIAIALSLSRATLYRVLALDGGVADFIRLRRLTRAFELLSDPNPTIRTARGVAAAVGFSSESQFSHAFRRCFDMTPGELRALARHGDGPAVSLDRHVRGWLAGLREMSTGAASVALA
ncbi:helix-turn-helix domain-containing protein [Aureimonas sp. AU12]|uniref:helix-turn-helix domain-containing protein n=1 Tax=Aureimonas sp. AU12 TaxID=1638161 RepID=UPI0007853637|nr:helix-turn-helix domain-containing protein [Aureimonas sp. AU12]